MEELNKNYREKNLYTQTSKYTKEKIKEERKVGWF